MGRLTKRTRRYDNLAVDCGGTYQMFYDPLYPALCKLAHYEDLEEQGLLIKLDLNQYKRDDLDRCTHRHCNNCDKYRRELQKYKNLEEQGRLIEVVRCKDCHHRLKRCGMGSHRWCEIWEGTTGENDFCSYGVARAEIEEAEAKLKIETLPVLHGNTLPNSKEEAMKRLGLKSNKLKELEGDKE